MIIVIDDERRFEHLPDAEYYTDAYSGLGRLAEIWTGQHYWHFHGTTDGHANWLPEVGQIDELWLDHDLGKTDIMIIVKWLVKLTQIEDTEGEGWPLNVKYIWCHSMNPVGADNVVKRLLDAGYKCGHQAMPPLVAPVGAAHGLEPLDEDSLRNAIERAMEEEK